MRSIIFTTTTVKFRAYDNLGNEEAVGSQLIQIDATPPTLSLSVAEQPASAAQHVSGNTVFYRPGASGGTFRVPATTDDAQTGVASVDFPSIANVAGGGTQTCGPYRGGLHLELVDLRLRLSRRRRDKRRRRDNRRRVLAHGRLDRADGRLDHAHGRAAPYYAGGPVTFTLANGSDAGSGVDGSSVGHPRDRHAGGDNCSSFGADGGMFTSPDNAVTSGNCYRYTFHILDNVGNESTTTAVAKVDVELAEHRRRHADRAFGRRCPVLRLGDAHQFFRPARPARSG